MKKKLILLQSLLVLIYSCADGSKSSLKFSKEKDSKLLQPKEQIVNDNNRINEDKKEDVPELIEVTKTDLSLSCHLMDNLALSDHRDHFSKKYSGQTLYSVKTEKEIVSYKTDDMVENYFQTLIFKTKDNAKSLKNRLVEESIFRILEKQKHYKGILEIEDLDEQYQELNSCLKSNNHSDNLDKRGLTIGHFHTKNEQLSEEAYNAFVLSNFVDAVKVRVLTQKMEELEKKSQKAIKDLGMDSPRHKRGRYNKEEKAIRAEVRNKYDLLKKEVSQQLEIIVQNSPLLIGAENDIKVDKFINLVLAESKLTKELLKGFEQEVIDQVKDLFKENPLEISASSVLINPELAEYLDNFYLEKLKSKKIKSLIRKGLNKFFEDSNHAMLEICENNGEGLHHHYELVKLVLDRNKPDQSFGSLMTADHSGYCHLIKNEPQEDLQQFTWKTGTGLASIATGFVLQPFYGVGTPFIIGGSALIVGETIANMFISWDREKNARTINFGGWTEYKTLVDQMGQTYDIYGELGMDATFGAIGVGVAAVAKKTSGFVAQIDDLEQNGELGAHALKAGAVKKGLINNALLAKGDKASIEEYKRLLKQRHDNLTASYERSATRHRTKKKIDVLKNFNRNDIPAFHIFGKSKEETFGILDVLADAKRLKSEEGEKALEFVEKWMKATESYHDDLNSAIDAGFQAKKNIPELEALLKKYKREDFYDGQEHTEKITVIKNGVEKLEEIDIQEFPEIQKMIREAKATAQDTFARNSLEELTTNSKLYRIMDEQAVDHRKLQFLRDTLQRVKDPSSTQVQILERTKELLANPAYKPRPDAIRRLEAKELKAELTMFMKGLGNRKKLVERMQFKLSDSAASKIQSSGVVGRYIMMTSASTLLVTGSAMVDRYFTTGGSIKELRANSELRMNNIIRYFNNGYTAKELDCALQGRSFSFGLCMYAIIQSDLGVEIARAIVTDKNYRFRNDTAVVNKILASAHKMIELRKKLRSAELYHVTMEMLGAAYDEETKREIISLVEQATNGDRVVSTAIAKILSGSADNEVELKYLAQVTDKVDVDLVSIVHYIIDNKKKVKHEIKESGRLPQNLENMLRGQTVEDANINIENEDFFDFTVNMIDEIQDELLEDSN